MTDVLIIASVSARKKREKFWKGTVRREHAPEIGVLITKFQKLEKLEASKQASGKAGLQGSRRPPVQLTGPGWFTGNCLLKARLLARGVNSRQAIPRSSIRGGLAGVPR